MATVPHRYVTPTYPGAAGFDLYNVVSGGVGAGGSAFMDGAKIGGPNVGTYAVAFGEDATSNNANRGLRALVQNTDALDDLLHRDMAVIIRTGDVTTVGPVASDTLPVATFLGVAGTPNTPAGLNLLFEITDDSDNEIIDSSGNKVKINSVTLGTGDLVGGGGANGMFSGHSVTLNYSPSIPTGTTYRVYYGTHSDLSSLPADALTNVRIRGAQEIEAGVENLFRLLHGNNEAWDANWDSTIYALARSGLNDRYDRSSTVGLSGPETYFPSTGSTAGAGAWFSRTGPAITGYTCSLPYRDPINALFAGKFIDDVPADSGGATGFVLYGSRTSGTATTGESLVTPGAASFMALWPHNIQESIHASHPYTRISDGASAQFSNHAGVYNADTGEAIVLVTQAGDYFRTGSNSAVATGYDLLECRYGSTRQVYVIVAHGETLDTTNVLKVRVRNLDGTVPDFTGSPSGNIRWISLSACIGDGAGRTHQTLHSYASTQAVLFDGLFHQVPPFLSSQAGDDDVPRTPASFSAKGVMTTDLALQWGGFLHTVAGGNSGPIFASHLTGDGGAVVTGLAELDNFFGHVTTGNAITVDVGGGVTILGSFVSDGTADFITGFTCEATGTFTGASAFCSMASGSTFRMLNGSTALVQGTSGFSNLVNWTFGHDCLVTLNGTAGHETAVSFGASSLVGIVANSVWTDAGTWTRSGTETWSGFTVNVGSTMTVNGSTASPSQITFSGDSVFPALSHMNVLLTGGSRLNSDTSSAVDLLGPLRRSGASSVFVLRAESAAAPLTSSGAFNISSADTWIVPTTHVADVTLTLSSGALIGPCETTFYSPDQFAMAHDYSIDFGFGVVVFFDHTKHNTASVTIRWTGTHFIVIGKAGSMSELITSGVWG